MDQTTKKLRLNRLAFLAAIALAAGGCAALRTPPPDVDPVAREQINRMRSAMERIGPYRITVATLQKTAVAMTHFAWRVPLATTA